MISLPTLLGHCMAVLQAFPLCQQAEIVETRAFSVEDIKIVLQLLEAELS